MLRSTLGLLALAIAGCAPAPAPCVSALDPAGTHYGRTYAEWGVAWWQWMYGTSGCPNQILDMTGERCLLNQPGGDVFFLAGTFGNTETYHRSCTIPAGSALLIPLLNGTLDNGGVPAGMEATRDELLAQANAFLAEPAEMHVTVDGCAIDDLTTYAAGPTEYSYDLPATENVYSCFGVSETRTTISGGFAVGYWVLIPPLEPGTHEVHFDSTRDNSTPGVPEDDFVLDVTYTLTVE